MLSWARISLVILVAWALLQPDSVAVAQIGAKDKEGKAKECIALINERMAALAEEDWSKLERLARRYLQDCKGVFGSEDYSNAYEDLGLANIYLKNSAAALAASETCIDVYGVNAGCHVNKLQSLINLGRLSEARAELELTERLIAQLIKSNEADLRDTSVPSRKKLYSSKGNNLKALQKFVDLLRHQLYGSNFQPL